MTSERVRLERCACVATLTLNRPESRNALDAPTVEQLSRLLRQTAADPNVRVVELAAEGTCFSAGADLRAMRSMGTAAPSPEPRGHRAFRGDAAPAALMPKPTLRPGAGRGHCGGCRSCRLLRHCGRLGDAFFRLSEVQLGLVPAMVGPYLVEAMGIRIARRLMQTAERVDARRALEWGLVHEVVAPDELGGMAQRLIGQLLRGAPGAQAVCKKLSGNSRIGHWMPHCANVPPRCWHDGAPPRKVAPASGRFFDKARPPGQWTRNNEERPGR